VDGPADGIDYVVNRASRRPDNAFCDRFLGDEDFLGFTLDHESSSARVLAKNDDNVADLAYSLVVLEEHQLSEVKGRTIRAFGRIVYHCGMKVLTFGPSDDQVVNLLAFLADEGDFPVTAIDCKRTVHSRTLLSR
jgi:hypothetical protein